MTVDPILILPTSTPDFEAGIWGAVIDNQRDWTETEKEYLQRNDGIRESLMDWARFMGGGLWTEANLEFLRPYWKANADSLHRSSAGLDPTTQANESLKD